MIDYEDLQTTAAIATSGSPARAAARLGVHVATVYRRLRRLEQLVGGPLFERVGRDLVATERAQAILAAADAVEAQLRSVELDLVGRDDRLEGPVTLTTTDSLLPVVAGALPSFAAAHPAVELHLIVSNAFADLSRREAEVAVRPTRSPPDTLVGLRIAEFGFGLYAHAPDVPSGGPWIVPDESLSATPAARWAARHMPAHAPRIAVNSLWAAAELAAAGAGLALLPDYLATARGLHRHGDPIAELQSELWILYHPDLRRTPRIRRIVDHLAAELRTRFRIL